MGDRYYFVLAFLILTLISNCNFKIKKEIKIDLLKGTYRNCIESKKIRIYSDCCNSLIINNEIEYISNCTYNIGRSQKSLIISHEFVNSISNRDSIEQFVEFMFNNAIISDTVNQSDSRLVLVFENNVNDTISIFDDNIVLNDKYVIKSPKIFKYFMNNFSKLRFMCPNSY